MKTHWMLAACFAAMTAVPACAEGEAPYDVRSGDTLWGVSGKYWNQPTTWPKLWSLNPQVHNPHWIFPGDDLFLDTREAAPQEPEMHVIPLVLEKLEPPPPPAPAQPAESEKATPKVAQNAAPAKKVYNLTERGSQDFLSPVRIERLGTLASQKVYKVYSAEPEELEITLSKDAALAKGDRVTIFDDSRVIQHPGTGKAVAALVKVLGHGDVLEVTGRYARVRVFASYDAMEDGHGIMAYRAPVRLLEPMPGPAGVEGVVLASTDDTLLTSAEKVVFIDRGAADGLKPGMMVAVPYPRGPESAEGITLALDKPIARGVVVSAQEKTSTVYLVETRKGVKVGHRAVASADSP